MGTRRPLEPLAPLSPNVIGAKFSYTFTKVGALDDFSAMAERVLDEGTQGSGSGGSLLSGLTDLDNDTDEFGRQLIRHARDEQRMNDALRTNTQPFRKARPHPRVGLTLENLERNNGLHQSSPRQNRFSSPASVNSSDGSEPPLNVPRDWGRKGRHKNDWLRRINAVDEAEEPTVLNENADVIHRRRTTYTGDISSNNVDWSAAAADVPLPSVDNSPLSYRASQRGTPGSVRDHSSSIDRIRQWEVTEDLTVGSLLASTPAIKRNTTLDEIRQRELETVKERAVATSRLDRIAEKSPEERRRQRSSSRHSTNTQSRNDKDALSHSWVHPAEQETTLPKRTDSGRSIRRSPSIAQAEADGSPTSGIVVHKSSETVGIVDRGIQANAHNSPQRPEHHRQDSLPLLRRLARAASNSPSPRRDMEGSGSSQTSQKAGLKAVSDPALNNASAQDVSQQPDDTGRAVNSAEADAAPVNAAAEQPELVNGAIATEDGTGATNKLSVVTNIERITVEESLTAKTPVVTGEWIDTPRPSHTSSDSPSKVAATRRRSTSPSNKQPAQASTQDAALPNPADAAGERSQATEPSLPSSALAAVMTHRRASDDLGDSTINSLEDIVAPPTTVATEDADDRDGVDLDDDDTTTLPDLRLPEGRPKTEAEEQRRQEVLALQSMNARLRAARMSVREAGRGMRRMENRVDGAEDLGDEEGVDWGVGVGVGEKGTCKRCGCPDNGRRVWRRLVQEVWEGVRGLFWDGRRRKWWGLTWLGLLSLVFWSWFVTETVLCNMYCQPRYAATMVGYGVNPDAPRLPFVTVTMLFRPLRWLWRPVFDFIGMLYQEFIKDETVKRTAKRTAVRTATTAVRYTTRVFTHSAQHTSEPDLGMSDDEYV